MRVSTTIAVNLFLLLAVSVDSTSIRGARGKDERRLQNCSGPKGRTNPLCNQPGAVPEPEVQDEPEPEVQDEPEGQDEPQPEGAQPDPQPNNAYRTPRDPIEENYMNVRHGYEEGSVLFFSFSLCCWCDRWIR